jgi:hypothetical protein
MKVGIEVRCATCDRTKKPKGRSGPMGVMYCEPMWPGERGGCPGYWEAPAVGSLWPGETEAEFGYPVGPEGTKDVSA